MKIAQTYLPHALGALQDRVTLTYEGRFLRRKVLTLDSGAHLLVDLAQTTSLDDGGILCTTDGENIGIQAAAEPLLKISGDLAQLAWHIGNRHTPCQIEANHLLIQRDPVIAHMLTHLGATMSEVSQPFTPEGGAYGHGRTHAHDHGHSTHRPQRQAST